MEIFLGLCQKIGVFLDYDWTSLTEELRHRLGTTKEEIMLERWHQKLAEVEKESGRDHIHFLGLCGLLAVAYFVPEMLVPARERKDLTSQDLKSKLEQGRKLLERLLKQRLDDETVTKLLDAFSFDDLLSLDDDRPEGVLESWCWKVQGNLPSRSHSMCCQHIMACVPVMSSWLSSLPRLAGL
jgi:hypothetical protein